MMGYQTGDGFQTWDNGVSDRGYWGINTDQLVCTQAHFGVALYREWVPGTGWGPGRG